MVNKNKQLTTREIYTFIERMRSVPNNEQFAIASVVVWMASGRYEGPDGADQMRHDYKRELARVKRIGLADILREMEAANSYNKLKSTEPE